MHLPTQLAEVDPIVASFCGGGVGVLTSLLIVEKNNAKLQVCGVGWGGGGAGRSGSVRLGVVHLEWRPPLVYLLVAPGAHRGALQPQLHAAAGQANVLPRVGQRELQGHRAAGRAGRRRRWPDGGQAAGTQ